MKDREEKRYSNKQKRGKNKNNDAEKFEAKISSNNLIMFLKT